MSINTLRCSAVPSWIIEISYNSLDLSLQVIPFFHYNFPIVNRKILIGAALNCTDLLSLGV